MSDLDICTMGATRLDKTTNAVVCQAVVPLGGGEEDHEPFGEIDVMQCLGITALPAPKNDNGHAEGVVARGVGNANGVIVGGRDTRSSKVTGELKLGETAVHSTGENFDSRSLYKDQMIAHIVGNDMVFIMDRKGKKVSICYAGNIFELSKDGGINLSCGSAGIKIKDGAVNIYGNSVTLGGMVGTPATAVIMGVSGIAGVPAPNVFVGV